MTHLSYEEMSRQRALAESRYTRRTMLRGGLKAAGGLAATGVLGSVLAACGSSDSGGAATGGTAAGRGGTVREIGLSLTEDPRIFGPAQKELGITIEGKSDNLGNQITFWQQNYRQFDIDQLNFNQLGAIQDTIRTIPTSEISAWNDQVMPLFLRPGEPGYNERSGWPIAGIYTRAAVESRRYDEFQAVPTWFGFDAFGYLDGEAKGDLKSYGAIFDPANKGHATLLNEPITTVMKVATYLEGSRQADFRGPINNLTKDDLAIVFRFLGARKADGQFRLFWSDFGQLVDLLTAGEVWIGDFWASAVAAAAEGGARAVFVNDPAEGSNGWIQGCAVSKEAGDYDAAIRYIDWSLERGVVGSILGTQGYYSPRPDSTELLLAEQDAPSGDGSAWDYWYEGAVPDERPSLDERLKHVADWQAYPDEFQEYSRLWTEFTAA
jgi:putative spermidine/putrescine transport system substrate-binding protein